MSSRIQYEVAVVGGGLAGLASAIQLAKLGNSAVLFEKNTYPFHKVCGEYISNESSDFVKLLGIPLETLNLPNITRLKVTSQSGFELNQRLDMGGFGISRYLLDNLLYKNAKQLGVTILEDCQVNNISFQNDRHELITKHNEKFSSKVVIGSYGKRSNLDIALRRDFVEKRTSFFGVKYHIQRPFDKDLIELHNFKNGYCGISRVEGENVCLCYLTTNHLLKQHGSIQQLEHKVLCQNPFLKEYLLNSQFLFDKPITISQINFGRKNSVEQHVLMAGDTAGLISPLCGNGMSMALFTANYLSTQIHNFLNHKITRVQMEDDYKVFWNNSFKTRINIGKILQSILGNPYLTDLSLKALHLTPTLTKSLISLTHGQKF